MLQLSNRLAWSLMALLSVAVALVSYRYLLGIGPLAPDILRNAFRNPWLNLHVAGAATALLAGPGQFVGPLRRLRPQVHRWLGRTYAAGCIVGGLSGFVLAWGSTAGPIATAGFASLAVIWIATTVQAWRLALQRRFAEHRAWMIRSFALTFAAVTLRLGLAVLPLAGMSMLDAYRAMAFLSWIPNLIVVELLLARQRGLAAA
ncbi:DUF2306 domain-containing protein [Phenylobacterium sp. LjRoot225]|uniref:DUF2306 domain-containing protein n=1 Tax=Phenylobacterium sp. LjRoot225 TaxID=3342285 RepID=UPI003ECF5AC9